VVSGAPPMAPSDIYSPEGATRRRQRRIAWWLGLGIAACAAVAVVTDLPTRASSSYRRSDLTSFLGTISGDVGPCNGGLHDAVAAYHDHVAGRLPDSTVRTFVSQGIASCSFANSGVVDLGGVQPPRSLASLHLDGLAPSVDAWAYLDAFSALQDLRDVQRRPTANAVAAYDREIRLMDRRQRSINRSVEAAEHRLGMRSAPFGLVSEPPLSR
jgi:hypothetical protein